MPPRWKELIGQNLERDAVPLDFRPPSGGWWLPESAQLAEHHGKEFVVADYGAPGEARIGTRARGLLERFVKLESASSTRVCSFVSKFGLIEAPTSTPRAKAFYEVSGTARGEEVQKYRELSGVLTATLRIARRMQVNIGMDVQDIATVKGFLEGQVDPGDLAFFWQHPMDDAIDPPAGVKSLSEWRNLQSRRVAAIVNWWMHRGRVSPTLVIVKTRPVVRWSGGLWGAIGGQLLYAVRREEMIAVCDYCNREFPLTRKPRRAAKRRCCGNTECARARSRESMRFSRASTKLQPAVASITNVPPLAITRCQ